MLKRAYFDDSHDERHEKYAIAAGVVANHSVWTDFNAAWKRILKEQPSIRYFHTREWKRLDGEFWQFRDNGKWSDDGKKRADEKREKLKAVIGKFKIAGLGLGVMIQEYRAIRAADPRAAEYFHPDPYQGALQSFVFESAAGVRKVEPNDVISYVSDLSNRSHIYTALYYEFVKKNPGLAPMLRGITHLNDEKWPGLQAADIVASITNQVFRQTVDLPAAQRQVDSLPELEGSIWKIAHWDTKYMCHILHDTIGLDLFDKMAVDRAPRKSDEQLEVERLERTAKTLGAEGR